MRTALLLIFFFSYLTCFGQLPKIISNTSTKDSIASFVFTQFNKEFDFLIAYNETNVLYDQPLLFKVIAFKGNLCHKIEITQDRKTLKKILYKDSVVNRKQGITLLNKLTEIKLWKLNNDSLNNHCYRYYDTIQRCITITDGIDYSFQVITRGSFKKIETSNPEGYIEKNWPSVVERKIFVLARKLFKNYWDKN